MPVFDRGQTFRDKVATSIQGQKPKYFIAMSSADFDDDVICCFVMNTEHGMDKLTLNCNKNKQKFVIAPKTFSFVTDHTSIMLNKVICYRLSECCGKNVELKDVTEENLLRQIKNCIDWNFIEPKFAKLIKDSFKS